MKRTLAQAMRDPNLLGGPFQAESFWPWHAVAKLISGEQLNERETALALECTGRKTLPAGPVNRLIMLAGRRAGKDRFMSAVAVHRCALSGSWRAVMSAGEQASVILLGADKKQSRILRRYCQGLLATPLLVAEVTRTSDEMVEFRSGATLEIVTNDESLVRGRSAIAVLGSECCWWNIAEDSKSTDEDVVNAALPAMSMTPDGGLLMLASSVGARVGYMHRRWKELWGDDNAEDLCWLAPSRTMNPALSESVVARAYRDDPQRAKAEYDSIWRDQEAAFLSRELVGAAVDTGIAVREPVAGRKYFCGVDISGGVSDSYVIAISSKVGDKVVLNCIASRAAPFSPQVVTREMARIAKQYHVSTVVGDAYSAAWCKSAWAAEGITYKASQLDRSEAYAEILPLFSSGRARLLDHPKLCSQLCALVRKSTGVREKIDHPQGRGYHDDEANACALSLGLASATSNVVIGKSSIIVCSSPRPDIFASAGSSRAWDRTIRTAGPT